MDLKEIVNIHKIVMDGFTAKKAGADKNDVSDSITAIQKQHDDAMNNSK